MTRIRYRRHFTALCIAVPLLWVPFAHAFPLPRGSNSFFFFYFAWLGGLHAIAIVVALRPAVILRKAVAFVALAALWSVVTPALGMALAFTGTLMGIHGAGWLIFIPLSASAFGTIGYWFLVRRFWIPELGTEDYGEAVGLCMTATALSWAGMFFTAALGSDRDLCLLAPTLFWWTAFSFSIYRAERRASEKASIEVATA